MTNKICPYMNLVCVKASCMAWVKVEDRNEKGEKLGTYNRSYCGVFKQE